MTDDLDTEEIRMHLAQAFSRAVHPDAREHIHAALCELDPDIPDPLVECPVCKRVGMRDRIREHACPPSAPKQ